MTTESAIQLTSDDINNRLRELDGAEDLPYEAFGGKAVPYIGWFWRTVHFESNDYWFGILPVYEHLMESNDKPRLGFMENNKWDYDYCYCPPDNWSKIKQLLTAALLDQTHDKFKVVDDQIQALLNQNTEHKHKHKEFPRDDN